MDPNMFFNASYASATCLAVSLGLGVGAVVTASPWAFLACIATFALCVLFDLYAWAASYDQPTPAEVAERLIAELEDETPTDDARLG